MRSGKQQQQAINLRHKRSLSINPLENSAREFSVNFIVSVSFAALFDGFALGIGVN